MHNNKLTCAITAKCLGSSIWDSGVPMIRDSLFVGSFKVAPFMLRAFRASGSTRWKLWMMARIAEEFRFYEREHLRARRE